jgi:hypothetical protein
MDIRDTTHDCTRHVLLIVPLVGLVAMVLMSSAVAWADIYKCPDGKGGFSFQQEPCRTGEVPVIKERNPYQEQQEREAARKAAAAAQEAAAVARTRRMRQYAIDQAEMQKEASTPTPPTSIAGNPTEIMLWCGRQAGIDPKAYVHTVSSAQWQALDACVDRHYMKR